MRESFIILAVVVALLAAKLNRTDVSVRDLGSVKTPIEEQKRAVLLFLRDLECRAHSPCFYAVVDGGLQRDPRNALARSMECEQLMKTVTVPANLPESVRTALQRAKDELAADVERHLATSDAYLASIEKRPRRTQASGGRGSTCNAYALISKVTKVYGIDKMMRGKYVDCEVLAAVR